MCWRPEMCIVQYSKVISSAAKGLLQRADEKCADLWGPRKESGNWLLVQVNHCHPTEAWADPEYLSNPTESMLSLLKVWVAVKSVSLGCTGLILRCLLPSGALLWLPFEHFLHRHQWVLRAVLLLWHERYIPSPCAEHYPGLTWVCNLLFCCSSYSCPHLVFHTFPALGRQLCHCHLPHICCSVLLDADPWSSHCWLLAGKV